MAKQTGTIMLDDYHTLVREVQEWQRKRDVAKGGLSLLLKRLKEEFGVATLADAKTLLEKEKAKRLRKAAQVATVHRRVEKKWRKRRRPG